MFLFGLTTLFIGLKLTGHIDDWSWLQVSLPALVEVLRLIWREVLRSAYKRGEGWAIKLVKWMG